ncbi:MAG TPA: TIGR01777 family oxidoreductase [Vicinamibacterales bacterium]|nr:TIGR01777 family oxidoreductase [Vicinamibacterales bacterium]
MKITVAGGSGFLGRALTSALRSSGHSVAVLTRHPRESADVAWSPHNPSAPWTGRVRESDVVVNLAGESIAGQRWTAHRKAVLRDSRLMATSALASAILASPHPPVFVSGSAVGFYGTPGAAPLTESSPSGTGFLAALCRDWEAAALEASRATRVVLLRSGVVLATNGGALPQLARPFWFLAGGPVGSGAQYVSWIHLDDWVSMTAWAIAENGISGPLNLTAPNPVTNAELAGSLASVIHRPALVRTPAVAVRLAVGEMADEAILNGQRVLPAKAMAAGFAFHYPTIDAALQAIYKK